MKSYDIAKVISKNGCFWRDLPREFGPWKRVYNYFNRLKHRGLIHCGYQGDIQRWFYLHSKGCLLSIVRPRDGTKGFQVQQWRWVVERSFAWLGNFRRLSKDYEITV